MRVAHYAFESLLPDTTPLSPAAAASAAQAQVVEAAPPPPPTFTEEQLAAAKAAAYEEGFMAGKKEGRREADHELMQLQQDGNNVLQTITSKIEDLVKDHHDYLAQKQPELGRLVLGCAQKLAVEALRKEPLADIDSMIRNCLSMLLENPEAVVYVHPRLQPLLAKQFNGKAKVVAVQDMNPIDCRIAWQYGEATRDIDHIWTQIEETIDRYFTISASEMNTQTQSTESPKGEDDNG